MAKFEKAIEIILRHEGGYVNDPDDPGGETNFGIAKRGYPDEDIKKMTLSRAKEIYHRDHWFPLKLNKVRCQDIAEKILDMCVNFGKGTGIRIVQLSLCTYGQKVDVDGIIGPQTIKALNSVKRKYQKIFIGIMTYYQMKRYIGICERRAKSKKFLRGWTRRAYDWNPERLGDNRKWK